MEEMKDQESIEDEIVDDEEYELSHTDKLVGVITEPSDTFSSMSKFPAKTADWIIPLLLTILVASLVQVIMMSNEAIKYSLIEKQMAAVEKQLDEAVASGDLSQEQADERLEQTRQFFENSGMGLMFSIISVVIFTLILFFIIAGVFYLIAKFGLKGDGNYGSAMSAYGLPYYVIVIQLIVMIIAALAMNKVMAGTSVADFLSIEKTDILGFTLAKLDPFTIWFYALISIGLAKMFKAAYTTKYFITVFGLWLGFNYLLFFLSKAAPFLGNFIR
ncbi:MAG: hypothetical protein HND52_13980 [Ignavibacteriae bacterium]|nr:hypothetical protein [Ignavibacteriota bacterium]NOG99063.1 hypothetical protein [Ignavibacteriota bacterium]